jgi:hypothetical protein
MAGLGERQQSWLRLPPGMGHGISAKTPQVDGRWNEAILRSFLSDNGGPWSPIIQDASGNLYGNTEGRPISDSEVFELTRPRTAGSLAVLYSDVAGPGLSSTTLEISTGT